MFFEPQGPIVGTGEYYCPAGQDHQGAVGPKFNVKRHMRKCKLLKAVNINSNGDLQVAQWKARAEAYQFMNDELLKQKEELQMRLDDMEGTQNINITININATISPYGKETWQNLPSFSKVQALLIPPEESIAKMLKLKLEGSQTRNVRMANGVIEVFEMSDEGPVWKQRSSNFLTTLVTDIFYQLCQLYGANERPEWIQSQFNLGDAGAPIVALEWEQIKEQHPKVTQVLKEAQEDE